jgi:DNA sulfur modification protein DndD
VLFGEAWTKPISQDGRQIKRTKRPLVGHPKDQVDPLLNTHAFLNNHYEFFVVITIEHNGVEYTITRSAGPRRKTVKSDSDMEVTLSINDKDSGSILEGDEAQDFIETEILPKNLSRFFFIDGESIQEYRALIASKDENLALRRSIEDILNFPILKRGIPDLDDVGGLYIDNLADLDRSKKRNRRLSEKIKVLSTQIKAKEKMRDTAEKLQKEAVESLEELHDEMEKHGSSEKLIAQRKGTSMIAKSSKGNLERAYQDRRRDNQELWINILQPSLKEAIAEIEPMIRANEEIRENIADLKRDMQYLEGLLEDDSTLCPTCGQHPLPRDAEAKKIDAKELRKLGKTMKGLRVRLNSERELGNQFRALERFVCLSRLGVILEHTNRINETRGRLKESEGTMREIDEALDGIDEEAISKLRVDIRALQREEANHGGKVRRYQNDIDELVSERSGFSRDLIGGEGTAESRVLNRKILALDWIKEIWSGVLDEYSQKTRQDVEKLASDTFRQLTNNPDGFSRMVLNENFGLTVLDAEGLPVQASTPGMMQVAAISLIDALGIMSDIEFPILFDTPGASIDQTHRENIVKHYWTERDSQFIIIPSSGEYRIDEVEEAYDHLIARTWELDFDDKSNKTKVINRVWN